MSEPSTAVSTPQISTKALEAF